MQADTSSQSADTSRACLQQYIVIPTHESTSVPEGFTPCSSETGMPLLVRSTGSGQAPERRVYPEAPEAGWVGKNHLALAYPDALRFANRFTNPSTSA